MRPLALLAALALTLAACTAESPYSLQGKPKLAGPRCPGTSGGCAGDPQP